MPLTPADIHNVEFKKQSIGKRGYDEEHVDAFLDELGQELIRLIEANNDLRTRMAEGGATDDDHQLAAELDELSARLDRVHRERAAAERAAREAHDELERARGAAPTGDREQAAHVLTMAERTADTHLGEAEREAQDLLAEARATARRITGDALTEAEALERDARRRHAEAISGLAADRTAAEDRIEDLEAFQREYRSRLAAHVESQLRDLDGSDEATGAERRDR